MATKESLEKKAKLILADEEKESGVDISSRKYKERTFYGVYTLYVNGKAIKLSGPAWSIALQASLIKGLTGVDVGGENILVYSDIHQVKVGIDRPELIVIYADTKNGKIGRNRRSIQIPHYRYPDGKQKPDFPKLNRGPHWGRLILKDNSRIIVHAATQEEARAFLKDAKKEVKPEMLGQHFDPDFVFDPAKPKEKPKLIDNEPTFGKRDDMKISKGWVPHMAQYYSLGQLNAGKPDWIYRWDKYD